MTVTPGAAHPGPVVSLRRYGATEESDVHDFHQIVLGLDGVMDMAVGGVEQRIDQRGAWIVPAGSRHDYFSDAANNLQLVVDLPGTSVAVPEAYFERARAVQIDPRVTRLVRQLSLMADDSRRFAWRAATQLCEALVHDASSSSVADARRLDFYRIDAWMRKALAKPLEVADLAAHCGLGVRRFHELFVEGFGETPFRYLQRLRLDTAVSLLHDPRWTLSQIALETGFADQSAFTHAFGRRFGMAPGEWRASN
jgi:AraC-like DNA-binding protein